MENLHFKKCNRLFFNLIFTISWFYSSKQKNQQEHFNVSGLLPACHFSFPQLEQEKHRVMKSGRKIRYILLYTFLSKWLFKVFYNGGQ